MPVAERLIGVDHIHAGTVVGKLEGDPNTTRGYYDVCCEDYNPTCLEHGIFFDQHWASLNKLTPAAAGLENLSYKFSAQVRDAFARYLALRKTQLHFSNTR